MIVVLCLVTMILPFALTIKMAGLAAVMVGSLLAIYFRSPAGATVEELVWSWLAYWSRNRYFARGVTPESAAQYNQDRENVKVSLIARKETLSEYVWTVWLRWSNIGPVRDFIGRATAFHALALGEPLPEYYRALWLHELTTLVFLAARSGTTNFLELAPLYQRPHFWALANVLLANRFLEWSVDGQRLLCGNVRGARIALRNGMGKLPASDALLSDLTTQV